MTRKYSLKSERPLASRFAAGEQEITESDCLEKRLLR